MASAAEHIEETDGRYQVECYLSGTPHRERRFDSVPDAKAYQAELHSAGFYFVALIDRDEPGVATRQGTRILAPLGTQAAHPWRGLR